MNNNLNRYINAKFRVKNKTIKNELTKNTHFFSLHNTIIILY